VLLILGRRARLRARVGNALVMTNRQLRADSATRGQATPHSAPARWAVVTVLAVLVDGCMAERLS
jgi:hypothetical protein